MEQEDELADTYWSGTAPICFGGCKGRHRELKRDTCGDSDCCWVGYKSLCRGTPDCSHINEISVIVYPHVILNLTDLFMWNTSQMYMCIKLFFVHVVNPFVNKRD